MKFNCTFFVLLTILFVGCNTDIDKAKNHYQKSKQFYIAENYSTASLEIDKSIALDSNNYEYLIYSANIKSKMGKNDEAIELLKRVSFNNFKKDSTNFKIGESYFSKYVKKKNKGESKSEQHESLKSALKFYNMALEENIRFYDAYIRKYKALHNIERYEDAIITINSAYSIFPDSLDLVLYRGIAKGSLGDHYEEMKDLNQAISNEKLDSNKTSIAYRFRGFAFREKNEFQLALKDYTNAIKYDSNNENLYNDRGDLFIKLGLTDSACQDYRKAAKLGFVKVYAKIEQYCN